MLFPSEVIEALRFDHFEQIEVKKLRKIPPLLD